MLKPKPNPATQARVDAHDGAARAKEKAKQAELTLARYHTQASVLGVRSIRFEFESDGIMIVLKGEIKGRNVSVEQLAPHGKPFVVYAVAALHEFEKGMSTKMLKRDPFEQLGPPVVYDEPEPEPDPLAQATAIADAQKAAAADIARRANPTNIHKPPPAGAGERKPLGLPLCKQCEAQPVYNPGAEFCGANCARAWHTANAGRIAKSSR